jgi:hypothetical protein
MKQHKWHKEIKAWADGAEIEFRTYVNGKWGNWVSDDLPDWQADGDWQYRIKQQPKEAPCLDVSVFNSELHITADRLFLSGITGKFKIKLENDDGSA